MLRSCKYCGRIHDVKSDCGKKPPSREHKNKEIAAFRHSRQWNKKANEIKQRDNYLCQVCIRNMYGTIRQFNYDDLSVHHIIPLAKNFEKRLDDTNLITLCKCHHELAERARIEVKVLLDIVSEQIEKTSE